MGKITLCINTNQNKETLLTAASESVTRLAARLLSVSFSLVTILYISPQQEHQWAHSHPPAVQEANESLKTLSVIINWNSFNKPLIIKEIEGINDCSNYRAHAYR